MSKKDEAKHRARYTLEFKLEAVRLVKGGQEASVTARILGIPKQTLSNWVRLAEKGELQGAGERPVSAEQMELARLRAELARVKMERDILKNRPRALPTRMPRASNSFHTLGQPYSPLTSAWMARMWASRASLLSRPPPGRLGWLDRRRRWCSK